MPDLHKYEELTELTFDHENAHLAVCHESQGFSANLRPNALVLKSKDELSVEGKECLEKINGFEEVVVEKASYRNLQRMLEQAIREQLKPSVPDEEFWVWLKDFDETTAVFEHRNTLYGVTYSLTEQGMVTLSGEVQEVVQQDVYVTEDGKSLVLKYKDSSDSSGEIITKGVNPDKGNKDMSVEQVTELEKQVEALQKAAASAEATVAEAVEKALAKQSQEIAKAALQTETTELVKGFEAVSEKEELVKSLVDLGDNSVLVIKALTEMQAEVIKSKEEAVEAQKSADAIKEEFTAKDEGVEGAAGEITKGNSMKDAVKAALAKTQA